jgi:crotonobetainyl-CoA:carnitine CoA-transferase CaiB-like acyl-CoA transferase
MGGLRALTGYPDLPPIRVGISIGDSLTGMFGAMGALAALEARRRTGRGQVVDASIFESVLAVTESLVVEWCSHGTVRERTGPTLPGIAPSNVYPTSDGQLLIAANQDSVFGRLTAVMGMPELATDPRFVDHRARGRNMHEIDTIVGGWTQRFLSTELLEKLHAAGVPAGLVYEPKDMLDDPHFQERGSLQIVRDERHGELTMQAVVPRLSDTPGTIRSAGPALGADTDAVLTGLLGLSTEDVAGLRDKGVVGREAKS